jgi:predicted alpha/beta-hydrolase family hydrolase
MPIEIFDFVNARGSWLSGRMTPPEVMPHGWVLLAHCFACGEDSLTVTRVSRVLARVGIGVLCFMSPVSAKAKGTSPMWMTSSWPYPPWATLNAVVRTDREPPSSRCLSQTGY